ncbi:hypothetical protein HDU96_003524, partial [Phlyctochytrium bullatum]
AKVRYLEEIPEGKAFVSRWNLFVVKTAEALRRLAGLDDLEHEMEFRAEFQKTKYKAKPEEDDPDNNLDEAPSLGHVFSYLEPFTTCNTKANVDDNPQTTCTEEEGVEMPELVDEDKNEGKEQVDKKEKLRTMKII